MRRISHMDGSVGERGGALTYLPEIDGLRAVAVVCVMLYHVNPALLPGGFVGVDIFFVISGYVVTGSLWRDLERPFPAMILHFYVRRIVRIVPALLVCLVFTAAATILFIPESWLSSVTRQTALSAFFGISNFALFNADSYFAPRTEFNPFAHTWTLGVEEQFYLLLPTIIYLSVKSGRRPLILRVPCRYLMLAITIVSAVILAWNGGGDQKSNFFLLPGRFWELGIGALLFQFQISGRMGPLTPARQQVLAISGAALIVASAIFADRNTFPFPWAIPPAAGALLVVAAISGQDVSLCLIARLLRRPQAVAIGKISYSLYLWHWSIYVLFKWTLGLSGFFLSCLAVSLTFLIAAVSYIYVEQPIRHGKRVVGLPKLAVVATGMVAVALCWGTVRESFAKYGALSLTAVMRAPGEWYAGKWSGPPTASACEAQSGTGQAANMSLEVLRPACFGGKAPLFRLFAVGDSHTLAYRPLLQHLASEENVEVLIYSYPGCAFMSLVSAPSPACAAFAKAAVQDIAGKAAGGDVVFLASLRMPPPHDEAGSHEKRELLTRQASAQAVEQRRLAYEHATELLSALSQRNLQVVVEGPPPIFWAPAFRCSDWFNAYNPICRGGLSIERDDVVKLREPVMASVAALGKTYPNLMVWDPLPILCPEETCRALTSAGHPLFFDSDHISGFASTVLYPSFVSLLHRIGRDVAAAPLTVAPGPAHGSP